MRPGKTGLADCEPENCRSYVQGEAGNRGGVAPAEWAGGALQPAFITPANRGGMGMRPGKTGIAGCKPENWALLT
jgi:hypothetical protein